MSEALQFALISAIEDRDAAGIIAQYAPGAMLSITSAAHPPANPLILDYAAIADYHTDVCKRDITHEILHMVSDDYLLGYTEICTYPTGHKVVVSSTAALDGNGKIVTQIAAVVWDS